MARRITIDPITRIEGHLSVELEVKNGRVSSAHVRGDMFRGFENIFRGRNPVDVVQLSQRICGVCPISHGVVSSRSIESVCGIRAHGNGRILQNLALASNFLQSHILHFYQLCAADFVDITALLSYGGADPQLSRLKEWARRELTEKKDRPDSFSACAPFLPRYEGEGMYIDDTDANITLLAHYVRALDMRRRAHAMVALFGGRVPHAIGLVPGGVTQRPTRELVDRFAMELEEIRSFVDSCYLPDVAVVARHFPEYFSLGLSQDFLAWGEFPERDGGAEQFLPSGLRTEDGLHDTDRERITEQVAFARYDSDSGLHPSKGETAPRPEKKGAYSWIKSPRYDSMPVEVGPSARLLVAYGREQPDVVLALDKLTGETGIEPPALRSALGRHAARALECRLLADRAQAWLQQLHLDAPPRERYELPTEGSGAGLGEAPRGALGHWITVEQGVVGSYQCVVPTTWNAGPRDDAGRPGPMEQALAGTPIQDPENPIEAVRVVHSFDPCIACAVHVLGTHRARSKRERKTP